MVDEDGFSAEAQLEKEGMRGPAEDFVWARKGWTERSVTTRSKDKNRVRKREGRTAGGRGIGRHGGKRARKGMLQYGKEAGGIIFRCGWKLKGKNKRCTKNGFCRGEIGEFLWRILEGKKEDGKMG